MRVIIIVISWVFMMSSSMAQNSIGSNNSITDFSWNNVTSILTEMNAQHQLVTDSTGGKYLSISGARVPIYAQQWACNDDSVCRGLVFYAVLDQPKLSLSRVNDLNSQYHFLKAHLLEDGKLLLSRYLTADHGIARGNVKVNLEVFASMAGNVSDSTIQVSFDDEAHEIVRDKASNFSTTDPDGLQFEFGHIEMSGAALLGGVEAPSVSEEE